MPAFSWRRFLGIEPVRAAWLEGGEWQHHNLISESVATPELRRAMRKDSDFLRLYGAVYAAIRLRVRAVAKPRFALVRHVGGESVEVENHPAMAALQRVNGSLTQRQGMGLIEQHKLTAGKAYWIKRRNSLGVPVEFEIWPPNAVSIKPDPKTPWMPESFVLAKEDGTREIVAAKEVVWFRHMVDPDNPLNGLGPLSAIRSGLDSSIEAKRFNQRFFDNSTNIGQIFAAKDAGQAEVLRIERDLERKFRGTDRAHRAMVVAGEVEALEQRVTHKDMEFLAQFNYTDEDVARVFELAPELLAAGSRTYENAEAGDRAFWQMIVDQVQATADEFNEFYIWPDFGTEFELIVDYSHIQALQADRKLQAEIDEINLRTAKVTINELRERDSLEPVAWGDLPIVNVAILGSLDYRTGEEKEQAKALIAAKAQPPAGGPPRSRAFPQGTADGMQRKWERRLARELREISAYLKAADVRALYVDDVRALSVDDVGGYDWDWWAKYGDAVVNELTVAFVAILDEAGFVETPLVSAQQAAADYARSRAGDLLRLDGRENIVKATREGVAKLVAETIENGDSLDTLIKKLRGDYAFGKARAETIARTETAKALNKGTLASYKSLGHEGKEWLTANDDRVCDICQAGQDEGPIPLGQVFNNGLDGPPPHPNCRCTLLPVREMGRVAVHLNGHSRNGVH